MVAGLGWSQERLAREIHSDPATVSRWLNGRVRPSKTTLARIAHATNVDFHWLLTGEGEMRPHDEPEYSGHNNRELLEMVAKVLVAGEEFRQPLVASIRALYRAACREEEVRAVEKEMVALRTEVADLKKMIQRLGLSQGLEHAPAPGLRHGHH